MSFEKNNYNDLSLIAAKLRIHCLESLFKAGSGHPGSSLSITEILASLFFREMNMDEPNRDRFVLSKGHAVPMLYSVFHELKLISKEELLSLRNPNSRLQGHPDMTKLDVLDSGSGALGQGLSISIGYALAATMVEHNVRSYCLLGDGEIQEGQIWEAAMFAGANKLNNLCAIIDANGFQNETSVVHTLPIDPIAEKWKSFGWNTVEVDGHSFEELINAFKIAKKVQDKPSCIIANTIKGKGVTFMENNNSWHGKKIDDKNLKDAIKEQTDIISELN